MSLKNVQWSLADFEIKEKKIKTNNQLKNMSKKISTKYIRLENMNQEQGTIKIKHINHIHATNNHNILTNEKEKKIDRRI